MKLTYVEAGGAKVPPKGMRFACKFCVFYIQGDGPVGACRIVEGKWHEEQCCNHVSFPRKPTFWGWLSGADTVRKLRDALSGAK